MNGLYSVLYSNLSNTIEHVGLDCASCGKHTCSKHFDERGNCPHLTCFSLLSLSSFYCRIFPGSIAAIHMFVMKAHTHLHVSSYLFLYLAGYESTLFGYGLTSLTLFSTHTHTHVTWLWCCFAVRQAYIVCRARGGL